ncbi:hypothetical protein BX661DRAFT_186068, partial [Kickxella alabastrina]|uniref:uncharacterized protein n=1 Tax=Kickxella alabastrina TaxID=61397 RepID=UPI00221E9278
MPPLPFVLCFSLSGAASIMQPNITCCHAIYLFCLEGSAPNRMLFHAAFACARIRLSQSLVHSILLRCQHKPEL